MKPKLHAGFMEVAVVMLLNYRVYTIVPNIREGLGVHECDLLALDKNGRLTEIEIKISRADLLADFKKKHRHESRLISRLIYAVPVELVDLAKTLIPPTAGLIQVKWVPFYRKDIEIGGAWKATWVKMVRHDQKKPPPPDRIVREMLRLGCMRIWSLKSELYAVKAKFRKPDQ